MTIQIVESCQPQPVAPESHLILHQLIQHQYHFTVRLKIRAEGAKKANENLVSSTQSQVHPMIKFSQLIPLYRIVIRH